MFRNKVPLFAPNPEEQENKNMSSYVEKKKRKLEKEIETAKEMRIKLEKEKRKLEKEVEVLRKFVPVFQVMKELRPWRGA